jgi:hypothetical protein
VTLTGGHRNDVTQLMPLIDAVPPVRGKVGRPRRRRWVIEQTIALLHWFRRLRVRWEIRDDIHEPFMTLASTIICWRRLSRALC